MAIIKSIINHFRSHYTRGHIVVLILLAAVVAIMVQLNSDIMSMTHGHYNMFDILFM